MFMFILSPQTLSTSSYLASTESIILLPMSQDSKTVLKFCTTPLNINATDQTEEFGKNSV
jgi:hypothetical protein